MNLHNLGIPQNEQKGAVLAEEIDLDKLIEETLCAVEVWYNATKSTQTRVCVGLAIAEILKEHYPLKEEHWLTDRGQVKTSGPLIKEILARFGEQRPYSREGGRTTRSAPTDARELVFTLNQLSNHSALELLSIAERAKISEAIQARMFEEVRAFFNRQKIRFDYDPGKPTARVIGDILDAADEKGNAGIVVQHLVGAVLAIRFPSCNIENHGATTADHQLKRPGDFQLNDSVFHVTMAPGSNVVFRCIENLSHGYRPILVVPYRRLEGARQLVEVEGYLDKIDVFPLELFIGQNIDELSEFRLYGIAMQLRHLLETYNRRLEEVETDLSLQVEIPINL